MIDYDTILSTTEDKLTLLQWLKKVEAALKDASATTFKVNKKGDATLTFSIVFANGSELESGEIVLQQGESVQSAAIVNGHLILTLTNGDELDAGDLGGVTSFSIDASQHLIVHYQNGTTQDLGAIFTGNVNIAGNLTADSIIENMTGYSFEKRSEIEGLTRDFVYAGIVKNGNKLTLAIAVNLTRTGEIPEGNIEIGRFYVPQAIADKLFPTLVGNYNFLSVNNIPIFATHYTKEDIYAFTQKSDRALINGLNYGQISTLPLNTTYYLRYEVTFLLSENLIQ